MHTTQSPASYGRRCDDGCRVLLIEDDPNDVRVVRAMVRRSADFGIDLLHAPDLLRGRELLTAHPDVVLLDLALPDGGGVESLQTVRGWGARLPVVVYTGTNDDRMARRALRQGASDYLVKGSIDAEGLVQRIRCALRARPVDPDIRSIAVSPGGPVMVGRSKAMSELFDTVERVAQTEASVVIHGETGTGKELVAQAIHAYSRRASGPMVSVNCAAFPDTLIDAELFGHARGAFTGAVGSRAGRFVTADRGTLFLDEIAELAPAGQAKLLRVLQEGRFQPVGSDRSVQVDVRVVCATHRDLKELVDQGRFRGDLYYRLKVLTIELPPLRDRMEDLRPLVDEFLDGLALGARVPSISAEAWAPLYNYRWPGNIRELRHAVEHALVLAGESTVRPEHLPGEILAAQRCQRPSSLADAIGAYERRYLVRALRYCGGHRTRTAALLGISRKNLWEKMRSHAICPEEFEAS